MKTQITQIERIKNLLIVNLLIKVGELAARISFVRNFLLHQVKQRIYKDLILANPDNRPLQVQDDKYMMGKALLLSIGKSLEKGYISRKAIRGLISVFLGNVLFGGFYKRRDFINKHGFKPPMFITISPTGACNLKCTGCYAASNPNLGKIPFPILDKIIKDAKDSWGANFFVISGGEPLIYKSEGKTFLDLAEKHSDCFFLMYTNATLINKSMAKRLAELGNITPAISVEGLEEETDKRRGKGVFKKIMSAMHNLREEGVPFGMSITATKYNTDLIISEKFLDFYFKEQGAIYGWVFHYMPIGREFTLDLLPTPEQRVNLLHKEWKIVREKGIFLADFWNSGTSSDGCICAARGGGYFYIDWDGDVMPCVFIPYSTHNIIEVYKNGSNLSTVINSELFKSIRHWQAEYGYEQPPDKVGNLLRQCPIRDHYGDIYKILKSTNARPIDENAQLAIEDADYRKGLIKYGEEIEKLTGKYWKEKYLNQKV
ncbi:radical SAM protein [candidate division WOR-3 bacterium]|nr:radical SAM protein [candidate division WOR-3 bacterium]